MYVGYVKSQHEDDKPPLKGAWSGSRWSDKYGMCSESSNPFKFWEMSNNISETAQDRDIVAMEG